MKVVVKMCPLVLVLVLVKGKCRTDEANNTPTKADYWPLDGSGPKPNFALIVGGAAGV